MGYELGAWCMTYQPHEPPSSKLGEAIRYLLNNKEALERFLDDGVIPIGNGVGERLHVRTALTGRNYLYCRLGRRGRARRDRVHDPRLLPPRQRRSARVPDRDATAPRARAAPHLRRRDADARALARTRHPQRNDDRGRPSSVSRRRARLTRAAEVKTFLGVPLTGRTRRSLLLLVAIAREIVVVGLEHKR